MFLVSSSHRPEKLLNILQYTEQSSHQSITWLQIVNSPQTGKPCFGAILKKKKKIPKNPCNRYSQKPIDKLKLITKTIQAPKWAVGEGMKKSNKQEIQIKTVNINSTISLITLNKNGLNTPI